MRCAVLLWCSLLVGCSSSAVLQSARTDDAPTFRERLPALLRQEDLSLADAQEVALTIMRRDVEHSRGRADLSGLEQLAACAEQVDDELEARARRRDDVGALACMIRIDQGLEPPADFAELVTHRSDRWRAVGARALVLPEPSQADGSERARRLAEHGRWRRKLMADHSKWVRRAAMAAAAAARDPHDGPALLEAARLDPNPEVRAAAIRAAAAAGGPATVVALHDLWARATDDDRVALTKGWAALAATSPAARSRLVRIAETDRGRAGVSAAAALLKGQPPEEARADVVAAAAALRRRIEEGAPRVRADAIDRAPLPWPEIRQAVAKAADDPDPEVAAAAHARLLAIPKRKQAARKALRDLATVPGRPGARAKAALAHDHDETIAPLLEADARSKSALERAEAGSLLAHLGKLEQAVALLADPDARVRAAVACALVQLSGDDP